MPQPQSQRRSKTTFRLHARPLINFLAQLEVSYALASTLGGWCSRDALVKQLERNRVDGFRVDQLLIELGSHITLIYPDWLDVPETVISGPYAFRPVEAA